MFRLLIVIEEGHNFSQCDSMCSRIICILSDLNIHFVEANMAIRLTSVPQSFSGGNEVLSLCGCSSSKVFLQKELRRRQQSWITRCLVLRCNSSVIAKLCSCVRVYAELTAENTELFVK